MTSSLSRQSRPLLSIGVSLILVGSVVSSCSSGNSSPPTATTEGRCGSSDSTAAIRSLEAAAHFQIVVVGIGEDRVESKDVFGNIAFIREDYAANVGQYLTGSGDPKVTIAETKQIITTFSNGQTCTSPSGSYVKFESGRRYVLFGTKKPDGLWSFVGVPYGFEVTSDGRLRALNQGGYTVEPQTWGLSSLEDMKQKVAAIVAGFPTATPSP